MGGGEGAKGNLKNEEAEQVGGLEPDPRYIRCCSAVCRPGYALRDALLGLLVLLGLSVVVTVIFVVCFYVIPDEKQLIDEGILSGTAKGVIGGPEHVNEVTLREGDRYTLPPHNFDDGGTGGALGDIHEGLSPDFSTFVPPSGGVQDTTDPALHLQDDNPEMEAAQDLPIVHHEDRDPEESLQPRENFDLHLLEELNDTQSEPSDGSQDGPEETIEHGHFQRDGDKELLNEDRELHGSRVHPEESADYVALPDEEQEGCSPVQLPMCISSVPWTLAGSPNWLNHTSEEEMFAALPYIRSALLDSGCSSLAPLYACSVLEPPCRNSRVLPPCRAFCEEVAQSCQPFVQGAGLPGLFHCSRYPDSADPSVCISAQQECSGDDDFRCSTTGLCVPSSWLCDGADDCRDNSDEQNCPLTPGNDKTELNTKDTDPRGAYGNAEYSDTNADHLDEEYQAEISGIRIPPLGYPHFDSDQASTINDPALAGPSLNDPTLLEAAYRQENDEQDNLTSFQSKVPLLERAEVVASSAESTGKVQQNQESSVSKVETSRRRRPGRRNNSNKNGESLNKSDVTNSYGNIDSSSEALDHSDNQDHASSEKEDDLYTEYSVRNDHFQNHPIPDVDYPAKETFSVDSTSSVDQKYHQMSGDKIENESAYKDDDENKFNEGAATDNQDDSNNPVVRTPSQRLRERLSGSNRSRQNTNSPVTRRQKPTSSIEKTDNVESSTVEPIQKPTRPPSRLANFQDRFREWRDKRRPTLPSDLENLSPGRNSPAPGTPGTGRPYDLVRRRPQRITTPRLEPTEGVELLRENVNRGNKQRQGSGDEFLESSNIRRPITPSDSEISDPNDLNSESPDAKQSEKETIGTRPTRFRPGFRFRQQSRQRTDSNSENDRPVGDGSPISENVEIRDDIAEEEEIPEEVSVQLPGREFYGQPTHEGTNLDPESIKSYRPSIIPDRVMLEDARNSNAEEGQEQRQQSGEVNPVDELYRPEIHDTSYVETFGSIPPKERINKEPFDYLTPEENFENEYHEQESLPSELHSQRDDVYSGQDHHQYSNEYGTNDDEATYTQQSGEDEPYRPPEYRPQRAYEQQNYQEHQQQQESIRPTVQRFPQSQGTRPQGPRPFSEDNSQFSLPNDFRVSFPPPRSVRPHQQAQPQRPVRPHQQTPGTSNSFYNSEDAQVSDLRYDVQGVNEQQYPTYQQPPIGRRDAYGSPYAGQQAI